MKSAFRPRRVISSGIIAAFLCAGSLSGYAVTHPEKTFAFSCPGPNDGRGDITINGSPTGTVTISAFCTSNTIAAHLNAPPAGSSGYAVYIYRGNVGQGAEIARSGASNPTQATAFSIACNNYYYAYAAYTYNGVRYGANTNAIWVGC